ncbi:uncharacterized protein TNIN_41551 [Trichonephila inaurata madagascariensis]|uniref:Uncharacterized protein n=1 Tax=Trichonephila inaurata madagascariensis TaxID=2747483 RepID=A0A8X6M5Z7_9ARAC|nr:uncharacterized protein TNIN_41551 [Trichonephila inaurata madagascariensis]
MACSRKEATKRVQKLVILNFNQGKSIRNIAKLLNVPHSAVQYVIKSSKEENKIENNPKELIQCDQRFIVKKCIKKFTHLNATKVSMESEARFFSLQFHLKLFFKEYSD